MNVLRVIFRSKYKKILKERRFEKLSGELYPKILKCMRDDAPYLNADFTIRLMAGPMNSQLMQRIAIHPST